MLQNTDVGESTIIQVNKLGARYGGVDCSPRLALPTQTATTVIAATYALPADKQTFIWYSCILAT